mmetsp:Transcript_101095/g.163094  ORF Transcript_101095/g.163094 Transcript_101095/m.163094 type:complete len:132 (+) Transcript_101095:405-800(+)
MRHESRIEPPLLAVRDLHFLFFSCAPPACESTDHAHMCLRTVTLKQNHNATSTRQEASTDTGPGVFLHQGRRASRKSNSLLLPSGQQVESQPAMQLSKTRSLQTPSALFPNQQFEVVEGSTRWQGNDIPGS